MTDLILPPNGAPTPPPPTSPAINFTTPPDGMMITIALARGYTQQMIVAPATLFDICKKWRDIQREVAGMQALALEVKRTKH